MDLLQSLKASTQSVHRELEQLSLFKKIITNELTLNEYRKILCGFYSFIYPCEQKIQTQHQDLLLGREKSQLLYADLVALKCDIKGITLFSPEPTTLNTSADILGYLYVMEGATLGGQVILKSLLNNPQLPSDLSTQYFNAYGKQTREKWDVFTQVLSSQINDRSEQDHAIHSAVKTFDSLHHWLKISL